VGVLLVLFNFSSMLFLFPTLGRKDMLIKQPLSITSRAAQYSLSPCTKVIITNIP